MCEPRPEQRCFAFSTRKEQHSGDSCSVAPNLAREMASNEDEELQMALMLSLQQSFSGSMKNRD